MSVLVLDPRWPNLIPIATASQIEGPVVFTDEVPIAARWDFGDLVRGESPSGEGWLVTTDITDPTVQERISRGEKVHGTGALDDPMREAISIMHAARTRGEWEKNQTHETLLKYLEQETKELAEVIRTGVKLDNLDDEDLRNELADVLLQVLFHAEIAAERGAFTFDDVAAAFAVKMRNRAPYLFDGSTGSIEVATQDRLWEEGKRKERGEQ